MKTHTATGLVARYLRWAGFWAITLPWGIYILPGREYLWLIRHEQKHAEQYDRFGVFGFLIRYFWYQIRYGYENNPLEIEARVAEIQHLDI